MRLGSYALLMVIACTGCSVERTVTVRSDPPGALVWLNDQEIGRTPVTQTFKWYGVYDVEVRKEGYQTLKTTGKVFAPWWQWVPFDLAADLLPFRFTVERTIHLTLRPTTTESVDPGQIMARALDYRQNLNYSENTRARTTAPSTTPATTKPVTTQPGLTQR